MYNPHLKYVVDRVRGSVMARTLWWPEATAAEAEEGPPPVTAVAIAVITPPPPDAAPPEGRVTFSEEKVTRRYAAPSE